MLENLEIQRKNRRYEIVSKIKGFPQALRTWRVGGGESSKFDGGLESINGGAWGENLKRCQKIPVKEVIC